MDSGKGLDLTLRGPCRHFVVVDSAVALNAIAKGRSPSRGLAPIFWKIAAVCVAAGLYISMHYCPTRLNPADCPPEPVASSFVGGLGGPRLYEALAPPKLKRWIFNWARLALLLLGSAPDSNPCKVGARCAPAPVPLIPLLDFLARDLASGCSGSFGSGLPVVPRAMESCCPATVWTSSASKPN